MTNKISWIAAALLLVRPDPGLTQTGPPPTDTYLVEVTPSANGLRLGEAPRNITRRQGYDNQPAFLPNGEGVLFTSFQTDGQTDIMLYDLDTQTTRAVTRTPESEYSATPIPGSDAFSVIRVEKDERQRLWRFSLDGAGPSLVLPDVAPVGYHVWGDERTLLLFVLGRPPTLRLANAATGEATIVKNDPGRSLHKIPERDTMSFVDKSDATWWIRELHPRTRAVTPLIATLEGSEDHAWFPDGTLVMARGGKLYRATLHGESSAWGEAADWSASSIRNITRLAVSPSGKHLAFVADAALK